MAFPEWEVVKFLSLPAITPFIHALTSIQQFLDCAVVVGKDSIVQGCAALEAGAVVQPVVEVILSGDQDWGGWIVTQTLLLATKAPSHQFHHLSLSILIYSLTHLPTC